MEIRFPKGIIFACIDENDCGFIKIYDTSKCKKIEEVSVAKDNLSETLKTTIDKLKGTC